MITAAAYIRVSTEDQMEFSPDSQLKRIMEYAEHYEMQIPREYIFIDEGISGRTANKRPAFQQMISLARTNRPFQKILVWKFSRFARNRQDSIFYKSMLRKDCGIEVISITEPLTQDPTSILIEALLEAMDEYYSINLAQEVKRGMQERFSRGKAISIPPFGYQMGNDGFEINPSQAEWIPIIFEDYIAGKSPREIAEKLNDAKVKTSRGNRFEARNITYILHNPVYVGKLRKRSSSHAWKDCSLLPKQYDRNYEHTEMDFVDGIHQPLITSALWELAQRKWISEHSVQSDSIDRNTYENNYGSGALRSIYYLQGIVHCSHCGRYLVRIHKGTAFQCSGYNHGICKISHYVKTEVLEKLVMNAISCILSPSVLSYLEQPSVSPQEKNEIFHHISAKIVYNKRLKQIILCPYENDM